MENAVCYNFESYLKSAENIFDIMAAAYKALYPFDPRESRVKDTSLIDMVSCFAGQYNMIQALSDLKDELASWLHKLSETEKEEIRGKLFYLIRLIDQKCIKGVKSSLPDPYDHYYSLNKLFQDEIVILPRPQSGAIDLLSTAMAEKYKYGFYGRNHAGTAHVSRYLHNFTVNRRLSYVKPRINVLNSYDEIRKEFERKKHKLTVAVFPLSNVNLRELFQIQEEIIGKEGLFRIESPKEEQEKQLLQRCIRALEICRDHSVDIVVFPEMLFSDRNQKAIIDFVKDNENAEKRFPWFMWLGSSWAKGENKCMVIDQYGKEVFTQKKYVPYEYKKEDSQIKTGICVPDGMGEAEAKKASEDKVMIREDLTHDAEWVTNFLDMPGFLRIATAICRDITDPQLKATIMELYSDMVMIPAFSGSDRMTERNIVPLAMERIITLACNACSAYCKEKQIKWEINEKMVGMEQSFCYLCMAAKQQRDNAAELYRAGYTQTCLQCDKDCKGYIWEIDFADCVENGGCYSANVKQLNL